MIRQTNKNGYLLGFRPGEQEPRPPVTNQAEVGKLNTGFKSKSRIKIIDCKAATLISSCNVRSLKSKERMGELTSLAKEKRIDILCIQEHYIYYENVDTQMKGMGKGRVLAVSSGTKNTVNSTVGGVGILKSPFAYKSLKYLKSKFSYNSSQVQWKSSSHFISSSHFYHLLQSNQLLPIQ